MNMRIGQGYDVHRLVEGRPLRLGGVTIPYRRGLAGHSDADVLLHSVCDALLGAIAEGDIGRHFPDSEEAYENIDSRILLRRVAEMVSGKGFEIQNIDTTVVAQQPRLAPYIDEMRSCIAGELNIAKEQVSVKATTGEKLGFEGRGEGISASAAVLLRAKTDD